VSFCKNLFVARDGCSQQVVEVVLFAKHKVQDAEVQARVPLFVLVFLARELDHTASEDVPWTTVVQSFGYVCYLKQLVALGHLDDAQQHGIIEEQFAKCGRERKVAVIPRTLDFVCECHANGYLRIQDHARQELVRRMFRLQLSQNVGSAAWAGVHFSDHVVHELDEDRERRYVMDPQASSELGTHFGPGHLSIVWFVDRNCPQAPFAVQKYDQASLHTRRAACRTWQ